MYDRLSDATSGGSDETYKQRRRRLLSERMFELKRSTFTLSNKEWQAKTGKLLNRQWLIALSKVKNMEATYLRLLCRCVVAPSDGFFASLSSGRGFFP